jgi:hypothetical protein
MRRPAADVFAFERYFACTRLKQSRNCSQRSSLAGAIRADERYHLAQVNVH